MHIDNEADFELPGSWIDHPDRNWAFLARMLLDELLDQLKEARLVVALFQEANSQEDPSVERRLRHLHAKSFVYALDAAGQLIRVLKRQEQLPITARSHCERFLSQFGSLRDLRNSLQHIEDRLRGIGRHDKPIPSPLLVLGAFRNGHFGATTSEGHYVEIEISNSILEQAVTIVEDLIWCFAWLAPGNTRVHRPKVGA